MYEVEVQHSGEVKYCGRGFVTEIGERRWSISDQKVRQLEELIEWFDFNRFGYEAGGSATDFPFCVILVELLDGTTHEIHHDYGDHMTEDVAGRLTRLENRIESMLGTKRYVCPPFYRYRVEYYGEKPTLYPKLVVVARNVQHAVPVANIHMPYKSPTCTCSICRRWFAAIGRQDWARDAGLLSTVCGVPDDARAMDEGMNVNITDLH